MKLFIPADSAAVSIGANETAAAFAHQSALADAEVVRTGSRGFYWLEPMVEIEHEGRRIGFGPIEADEVPELARLLANDEARHIHQEDFCLTRQSNQDAILNQRVTGEPPCPPKSRPQRPGRSRVRLVCGLEL